MEKNLEFIGEQLKKLTAIPSPSSYTEKAAEYLMETLKEMGYEPELSISEIAERTGFSDSNYFCRQFRARYNVSPQKYRKLRNG